MNIFKSLFFSVLVVLSFSACKKTETGGNREYTSTFQPGQNPNEMRLAAVGSDDGSGVGTPDIIAAAWTVNGNPATIRGIFKFDLSPIPANAKIVTAKLSLFSDPTPTEGNKQDANFGTNNTMLIQRVTTAWTTSIGWQTKPSSDAATQIVVPHTSQSKFDLIDLDVTSLVKDMQQSGNHGFMIKLQNETAYNSRIFSSSRDADATKHPKLVIKYSN